MSDKAKYLAFAGRVLIGGLFVLSGAHNFRAYDSVTAAIRSVGLPLAPLGYAIACTVEIGFGFLLVMGYRARLVALTLAIWCVVTAILFHHDFADQNTFIHFIKNLMIAGGLLQIVHFGAGALGIDSRNGENVSTRPAAVVEREPRLMVGR